MSANTQRIQHCPSCDRKHDTSRLAAGRGFPCDKCSTVLIVPTDDAARYLDLADETQAARVRRRSRSAIPAPSIDGPIVHEHRPRIQLCPGCGRRHDTTRLQAGRGFPCDRCPLVLVVPLDPTAERLDEADPAQAERVRRRLRLHAEANALRRATRARPKPTTSHGPPSTPAAAPDAAAGGLLPTSTEDTGEALVIDTGARAKYGLPPPSDRVEPRDPVALDAATAPQGVDALDDSYATGAVLVEPSDDGASGALDESAAVGALLVGSALRDPGSTFPSGGADGSESTDVWSLAADDPGDGVSIADSAYDVSPLDDDASFVEDAVPIGEQDPGELEDSAAIEHLSGALEMLDLDAPPPPPEPEVTDVATARRAFTDFHTKAEVDGEPPAATSTTRRRTRGGVLRTAHAPIGETDTTRFQLGFAVAILGAMAAAGAVGAYLFKTARQDQVRHDARIAREKNPPPEPPPAVTPLAKAKVVSAETIPPGRSIEITGVVVARGSFPDRRSALLVNARGHGVFWVEDLANRERDRFRDLAEQCAGPKPVCLTFMGTTREIGVLPATHPVPPTVRAVGVWIEVEPGTIREVEYAKYLEAKETLQVLD